ncbi:MAG: type II toxin-antitoxin system PemK/MazF family toxin [Candidatus Melainabacteria bacterium]
MSSALYKFGDVILAECSFSDGTGSKRRPMLVIVNRELSLDLIACKITTNMKEFPHCLIIEDWQKAQLKTKSIVQLDKPYTIDKSKIKYIGSVSEEDLEKIRAELKIVYGF